MEPDLIAVAWIGGLVSGATLMMGGIGLVTGRVVINPRRIDWSVGEARLLGAVLAVEGVFVGVALLVTVWQLALNITAPPVTLLLLVVVTGGAIGSVFAVGRHHDARNPAKRLGT